MGIRNEPIIRKTKEKSKTSLRIKRIYKTTVKTQISRAINTKRAFLFATFSLDLGKLVLIE